MSCSLQNLQAAKAAPGFLSFCFLFCFVCFFWLFNRVVKLARHLYFPVFGQQDESASWKYLSEVPSVQFLRRAGTFGQLWSRGLRSDARRIRFKSDYFAYPIFRVQTDPTVSSILDPSDRLLRQRLRTLALCRVRLPPEGAFNPSCRFDLICGCSHYTRAIWLQCGRAQNHILASILNTLLWLSNQREHSNCHTKTFLLTLLCMCTGVFCWFCFFGSFFVCVCSSVNVTSASFPPRRVTSLPRSSVLVVWT